MIHTVSALTRNEKIILALFLCAIFLYSFNQLHESDSFYHLKTGQVIWETRAIPHADIFSFTALGAPWVTHEWLAEVIFYLISLVGMWALIAFVGLLAAATYYFVFQTARVRAMIPIFAALMLFLISYSNAARWIPRPQIWSYFFLALLIWCLEYYRKEYRVKYLLFTAGAILLWANMHASVVLGLGIIIWYAVSDTKLRINTNLRILAMSAPFVTLLNPNTYHVLTYSFEVQAGAESFNVLEWQPIFRFLNNFNIAFIATEIAIGLLIAIYWYGLRRESRDITMLGLLFGISLLPVFAVRHITLWPIPAAIALIAPLSAAVARFIATLTPRVIMRGAILFAGFFILLRLHYFPATPVDPSALPVYATDFIAENRLKGPAFNLYNEGGYFIWKQWPAEKVFIDGRSEVFPGEPTSDFFEIVGDGPRWGSLVNEKYHLNYFILDYAQSARYRSINKLVLRLVKEQWPLVYWDDRYIIFIRPSEENEELIARYGMRHINPFRPPESIPLAEGSAAEAELNRILKYFDAHNITSNVVFDYAWRFEEHQIVSNGLLSEPVPLPKP